MANIILRFGLLSGAVSATFMLLMTYAFHQSGSFSGGEIYGYGGMVLSMLLVYLGVRIFREKERGGVISFGEAFKIGGLIALISCICYVVAWMLVYEYLMPDFLEKYTAYYLEQLKTQGESVEKIQKATQQMEAYKNWYKNPVYRAGLTIIEPLPVALLMSLVSAALLQKKAS